MSKVANIDEIDKDSPKIFFRNMIMLVIKLIINVGLPILVYYLIKSYMAAIWALLISSIPPLLMTIFSLVKNRRVDALSFLIVVGFALSAILAIIDGDPRLLLLRESAVTCLIGLVFLVSLIPITIGKFVNRPIVLKISEDSFPMPPIIFADGTEMSRTEWFWQNFASYRRDIRISTVVWGVGLLLEFLNKAIMIQSSLTLDQLVYLSNLVLGCVTAILIIFTMFFTRKTRTTVMAEVEKWRQEQEQAKINGDMTV
ncbi:hypothetical protein BC937DRAFT_86879 [Endogone sp. FLAS-F59071]|nr:hypothetical protein BC937DRAFT_86879 [Endogone sp. FLAS-F59071]|eukprot:RUS12849.1 hypothetical protein BC937DRAFT_86879 [Endogone sp. FLAS-F59071]